MYFYVNRTSRNGDGGISVNTIVRRNMSKSVSDYLSAVDRLQDFHQRMSHMLILRRDGVEVLEKYAADSDALVYVEVPEDLDDEQRGRVIQSCQLAKAMVMLVSATDRTFTSLEGWGFKHFLFEDSYLAGTASVNKTYHLWRNFDPIGDENTDDINISPLF